jgi:hypothetical protein
VQSCLAASPPARSSNITSITNPPPPWNPDFGLVSTDVNPAYKEKWFAVPPRAEEADSSTSTNRHCPALSSFPGADSFHQVYWTFVRHLHKLLGWWMGDLPSYGMIMRIVFDPLCSQDGSPPGPAFVCEKVHLVNRLQGMGSSALRSPWMEAASFDYSFFYGAPGSDGTTIETDRLSIDVSVPGIKTERLWITSWIDCRHLDHQKLASGSEVAQIAWQGSRDASKVTELGNSTDSATLGRNGQPSIVSRARALAAQMVFGHASPEAERENALEADSMDMDEEEDEGDLPDTGPGVFGHGLTISQIVAASAVDTFENGDFDHIPYHLRTIQQRSGHQTHTVFLSSGAILTAPVREKGSNDKRAEARLSLRCEKYRPYENAEYKRSRAFGLNLTDYMPLPPLDFPPPALLPLVKDVDDDFSPPARIPTTNSSLAYERFIDQKTDFQLNILRMEPCPPYRPWPHLSQPQPSGLRFVSIQSPPSHPVRTLPSRKEIVGGEAVYEYPASIPPQIDPGSFDFDWDSLQGLYGMTYGPWGLETIYIRSRLLTVHDFKPKGVCLEQDDTLPRPTGPHGPGHRLQDDNRQLIESIHWRPEPYINVKSDLQMRPEEVDFIKPGCRVIEGVKCSGDANVPRGTISFRAFSRGQDQDSCIAYFAPSGSSSRWANFPPWDGRGVRRGSNQQYDPSPGRILDYGTGRLAMEGFVGAGCWKRCSVKITSADEIHVYWEALRKVAVAKRLFAC